MNSPTDNQPAVSPGLQPHPDGVLLSVKAQPGAKRAGLGGWQNGLLKVAVTQAAEKGKANQALLKVLAETLGLRKSQVDLLTGETARAKKVLVRNMNCTELAERIAQVLSAGD